MSAERRKRIHKSKNEREYPGEHAKLNQIYQAYDRFVWNAEGYPQEHRPDLVTILPKVRVGDYTKYVTPTKLHPDLKPELRAISETMLEESRNTSAVNDVAMHLPDGMQVYSPLLFLLDEMTTWETVAHETGHAIAQGEELIWPASYSEEQLGIISQSLPLAMQEGKVPDINDTHIVKRGFREVLTHGEYSISDVGPADFQELNELYPLTMELVCANIMARNGDIAEFDSDLAKGRILNGLDKSKQKFTRAAY